MSEPMRLSVRLGRENHFEAQGPAEEVARQFNAWVAAMVEAWITETETARSSTLRHLTTLRKVQRELRRAQPDAREVVIEPRMERRA